MLIQSLHYVREGLRISLHNRHEAVEDYLMPILLDQQLGQQLRQSVVFTQVCHAQR